jgi:hypothetical protein
MRLFRQFKKLRHMVFMAEQLVVNLYISHFRKELGYTFRPWDKLTSPGGMALPTCGEGLRYWRPYTQFLLEGLLAQVIPVPENLACQSVCGSVTQTPASFADFRVCTACLSQHSDIRQQYGCNWCSSVLAPMYAGLGRQPTLVEVQHYLDHTGDWFHQVLEKWLALSQCERGSIISKICFQNGDTGLPYSETDPVPSKEKNWWKSWWAISLFVILGLLGLLLVVLMLPMFVMWRLQPQTEARVTNFHQIYVDRSFSGRWKAAWKWLWGFESPLPLEDEDAEDEPFPYIPNSSYNTSASRKNSTMSSATA